MKLFIKFLSSLLFVLIIASPLFLVSTLQSVLADEDLDKELESVEKEIDKTKDKIGDLQGTINKIKGEIDNLSGSLSEVLNTIISIESEISDLEDHIKVVTTEINNQAANLTAKTVVRDRTLRNFYKKSPTTLMVSIIQSNAFLAEDNTAEYLKKYINQSVDIISEINSEISINKEDKEKLEEIKKQVEAERVRLLAIKIETEQKLADEKESLDKSNQDLGSLNEKLSGLLAKQQEILAAKSGNFNASLGEGVETDDPNASPNYNPGFSPAFAVFSYGAFTHYKGMSQYGAKGRAEDDQDHEEILEFYYKTGVKEKDDFPDSIGVEGYGDMDFQKYLYGLAEMPSDWPIEALKAQAIAARSYAYRYQKQGKSICTSQSCQVFLGSKSDNPPDRWREAVDDTKGRILENEDVVAFYSSTTGGYIENVGWDTAGSWPNDAYEKKGKSPWFYKSWYTESYSKNSAKCGRNHPWLTQEEMTDILNAWVLWKNDKDLGRISPITTDCWGGDPYSIDKMAEVANDLDGEFTSISSVSVEYSNNGFTSKVKFETNRGSISIDGAEFKSVFNLRAPGYIAVKNKLFDLRRK